MKKTKQNNYSGYPYNYLKDIVQGTENKEVALAKADKYLDFSNIPYEQEELVNIIENTILSRYGEKSINAIRLRYRDGLSYPQIANKLKMSSASAWKIVNMNAARRIITNIDALYNKQITVASRINNKTSEGVNLDYPYNMLSWIIKRNSLAEKYPNVMDIPYSLKDLIHIVEEIILRDFDKTKMRAIHMRYIENATCKQITETLNKPFNWTQNIISDSVSRKVITSLDDLFAGTIEISKEKYLLYPYNYIKDVISKKGLENDNRYSDLSAIKLSQKKLVKIIEDSILLDSQGARAIEALHLKYIDGMTYEQIGDRIGVSRQCIHGLMSTKIIQRTVAILEDIFPKT